MNVGVNNAWSESVSVRSGVSQGSFLGPFLYVCYSADLQHVVNHSTISMYADDSKLYKAIEHVEDCLLLQTDLGRISKWANDWQLQLNLEKTKMLTIGIDRFFSVQLYSTVFEVGSMCDLGVNIQSNLKSILRCNNVIKKAHYLMKNIFTTFKDHDYEFYKHLYTSTRKTSFRKCHTGMVSNSERQN